MKARKSLVFDKNDPKSLAALPAGVKLFLVQYKKIAEKDLSVASESINGLSQSFTTADKSSLLLQAAQQLLGKYLKSSFSFVPSIGKWR